MSFNEYATLIVEFVKTHQTWAAPIVFGLAFGESLAFLSLLLPASVILIGIGGLLGASGIPFVPVVVAAAAGSIIGYGISYYIGLYFKDSIPKMWPFSRNPEMIPRGKAFFDKWGAIGVFMGHFFGPVRAVIPVIAGMYELKPLHFWAANITSSCLWAVGVLAPGAFGLKAFGLLG
jgi:membrane protein DedA with SNARE-associated domain